MGFTGRPGGFGFLQEDAPEAPQTQVEVIQEAFEAAQGARDAERDAQKRREDRLDIADDWSKVNPEGYSWIRRQIKDQFQLDTVSEISERTKFWASRYKSTETDGKRWPNQHELLQYQPFIDSLWHYASGRSALSPGFGVTGDDGGTWWVVNDPMLGFSQPSLMSLLKGTGDVGSNLRNLTVYESFDAMDDIAASFAPIGAGPSGGGGGGGRTALAFDRRQLEREGTERWRGLLLEEPDENVMSGHISDYMTEANAFWMTNGGRLDFDTFLVDRIEGTPRHSYLYSSKPSFQSDGEYMAGFRNVLAGQGINEQATLREIEAGASSGAGLAGFSERVGRTREARLTNVGGFGNQLAGNMAATGIGRT